MRHLTLLLLLLTPAPATLPPAASPAPPPPSRALSPDELLSRRALLRARLLIQMRLMELREERLDCVRAAILRRLPPELRPTISPATTCDFFSLDE